MSKKLKLVLAASLGFTGFAALAHKGATGAVKVRMEAMGQIKDGMKILGTMAKGAIAFDADQARKAADQISHHAKEIPALFEEKDVSGPSESSESIWTDWDGFVRDAEALVKAAETAKEIANSLDGLRASIPELGQACKACHQDYRIAR